MGVSVGQGVCVEVNVAVGVLVSVGEGVNVYVAVGVNVLVGVDVLVEVGVYVGFSTSITALIIGSWAWGGFSNAKTGKAFPGSKVHKSVTQVVNIMIGRKDQRYLVTLFRDGILPVGGNLTISLGFFPPPVDLNCVLGGLLDFESSYWFGGTQEGSIGVLSGGLSQPGYRLVHGLMGSFAAGIDPESLLEICHTRTRLCNTCQDQPGLLQ